MGMPLDTLLENQSLPRTIKPLPRRRRMAIPANNANMPQRAGPGPSLGVQSEQGKGALSVDAAPGLLLPTSLWPLDPPDHVTPHSVNDSLLGWHSPISGEGSSLSLSIFSPEASGVVACQWSDPPKQESLSMTPVDSERYTSTGYSTPASSNPAVSDADYDDGLPLEPSGQDPTFWRWMDVVYVRLGKRLEMHRLMTSAQQHILDPHAEASEIVYHYS